MDLLWITMIYMVEYGLIWLLWFLWLLWLLWLFQESSMTVGFTGTIVAVMFGLWHSATQLGPFLLV